MDSWILVYVWEQRSDMETNKYSYTDSSHVEHAVEILPEDLKLVHTEKKMHDVDLKGKTTTYFKDILHRFIKNKISVFGFIIIALIILGSAIISVSMPEYNITSANASEIGLAAKLFPKGTGWWDGCVWKDNYIYDTENKIPVDLITGEPINRNAYLEDTAKFTYDAPITNASRFATDGGYLAARSNSENAGRIESPAYNFDFTNYEYTLTYTLTDEVTGHKEEKYNATKPTYDVYLSQVVDGNRIETSVATGLTNFGEDLALNLNSHSALQGKSFANANLVLRAQSGNYSIYLRKASMTTTDTNFVAADFNFDSANDMLLRTDGKGIWNVAGNTLGGLYMATVTKVTFRFDTYEDSYGNLENQLIGSTDLKALADDDAIKIYTDAAKTKLVDLKNMSVDEFTKAFSKKNGQRVYIDILKDGEVPFIIDDNPIIVKATSGKVNTVEFYVTMTKWKKLGYSSYPIHILGTDKKGYDLLKVTATGTLYSLGMAVCVFIFCFIFGLIWGSISGYFGGAVDIIMERIVDIISGVPLMVLLTLFLVVFGRNWFIFIFGMCFSGWIGVSGITRTQFYRFKRREYVLASRSLGATDGRLIFRHILPNGMGTIITSTVLMIPSIIYSEAGLAYLGLGFTDITSLGRILSDNQAYLLTDPLLILWPSIIIALLMISFELFGQGLRDAFNPSTKGA